MQLRPYQQAAIDTLWRYFEHGEGNPVLVLPTGAGKSPLMAAIAREALERWGCRVGILAHVQELVAQNADKMLRLWPEAPVGIYAAGLKRRDRFSRITFMQIQSVAKRAHELGKFDLLLVDEAHRIPLRGEGMYRQFLADARKHNKDLRLVGLTATPYRLEGAAVPVCSDDGLLNQVIYEARITDLIRDGYLSPLTCKAGDRPDLGGVHVRGGEYIEAELAAAMMAGDLVQRTVADMLARAVGRKAGIVFCVNVAHAEAVLAELRKAGEAAALVHGGTQKEQRKALIADFQRGALRWMVNVNVLSEGFDAPHIDCVAMLRPTKSPGLYYQQAGRGFRLAPGKVDCLVLDYAGNTLEHGPVDAIQLRSKRTGEKEVGTAPSKKCPACDEVMHAALRQCPACGHEFPPAEAKHDERPTGAAILSSEVRVPVVEARVGAVEYAEHIGKSGVPSLRVTYRCGLLRISEYVCLEHRGFARDKACAWWLARAPGTTQVPRTVEEALTLVDLLPKPESVKFTSPANGYREVVGHEFPHDAAAKAAVAQPAAGGDSRNRDDAAGDAVQRVPALRGPDWLVRALAAGGSR